MRYRRDRGPPPGHCGLARSAGAGRRRGPRTRIRRTGPPAPHGCPPGGGPRPGQRYRIDGALAGTAVARPATLGHVRPGRRSAGPRPGRPGGYHRRWHTGHGRDPAARHHPADRRRARRREPHHRLRPAGHADRGDRRGVQRPPAAHGRRPRPARAGRRRRHRSGLRPAWNCGTVAVQSVAAGCRPRRADLRVVAGVGGRRVRAAAGADPPGPVVRAAPAGRGRDGPARGCGTAHRPARRPHLNPGPWRYVSGRKVPLKGGALRTRSWAWVRPLGGVAILALLLWRLGTGPFLGSVRLIDGWALAAAAGIGGLSTVCCAWRWRLVADGLGVRLPFGSAVAHCYRSLFLNVTLPGGVVGDVHRAVSHGRDAGDLRRAVRAVVWERTAGQVVQFAIAIVILFALPSPVRPYLPATTALVLAGGLGAVLLAWALPRGGASRWARALRTAAADIRHGLLGRRNWPGIVLASTVVVAGHLATFLVAARTAGATAPASRLVPLTLLALLAMGLPANVAGFGPREGVAAWAFGAAGLTATQGVATAVVYGALVLGSSLRGAAGLVVRRVRLPAPVPVGHRPVHHARRVRAAGHRPGHLRPEPGSRPR